MADYYPLLSRAIAALVGKPDSDRQAIYGRAREALERQLRGFQPALPEEDIRAELDSLEATITRIEAETPSFSLPLDITEPVLPGGQRLSAENPDAADASTAASPELADRSMAESDSKEPAPAGDEPLPTSPNPAEIPEDGQRPIKFETVAVEETIPAQTTLRPRMPARREGDTQKKPLALFALVAVVAMFGMGLLALNKRETPASNAPPVVLAPETTPDASKTEGRLASTEAAKPSELKEATRNLAPSTRPALDTPNGTSTSEVKPATPVVPAAVVSRAFMVLEIQGGSPNQFEGRATWTFAPDAALKNQKALRAAIEFPAANFAVDFSVGRNTDPALNASHTVMVIFDPKNGIENVREMSAVEWRERENQTGAVLAGIIVPVQDNIFMIGLDRTDAAQTRNLDLLRTQKWMVFEIRLANGRRGAILVEKGANGEKAISDALAEWK